MVLAENPGVLVGTTKPRTPSSVTAQTIATSATDPLVIHILRALRIQADPAEQSAAGHAWQPLLLLYFGAESPDREHGQRPLYRDHRPDAGVGGLQLGTRQSVVHRRRPAAAVALQMHAEQSELSEVLGQVADREIADLEPLRDV